MFVPCGNHVEQMVLVENQMMESTILGFLLLKKLWEHWSDLIWFKKQKQDATVDLIMISGHSALAIHLKFRTFLISFGFRNPPKVKLQSRLTLMSFTFVWAAQVVGRAVQVLNHRCLPPRVIWNLKIYLHCHTLASHTTLKTKQSASRKIFKSNFLHLFLLFFLSYINWGNCRQHLSHTRQQYHKLRFFRQAPVTATPPPTLPKTNASSTPKSHQDQESIRKLIVRKIINRRQSKFRAKENYLKVLVQVCLWGLQ